MAPLELEKIEGKKKARRELLTSSLENIVPQLERMGALRTFLFGSLAEDSIHSGSDLDLLAVMPPDRPGRTWHRLIYEELERRVAADILVFNREEFEQELPCNAFLRHVVEVGRLILEKEP